jgi:hypothetical protein
MCCKFECNRKVCIRGNNTEFGNAIDFNRKDRAKPPARKGCGAYASASDTTNLSAVGGSIFNSGLSGLGVNQIVIGGASCKQLYGSNPEATGQSSLSAAWQFF